MSAAGKFKQLLPIWIMLGMIFSVVIAGFLVFPRTDEAREQLLASLGTKNKGTLLNPVSDLSQSMLKTITGELIRWHSDRPVWTMLIVAEGECDSVCNELLYLARQVHVRLDKNSDRVERFFMPDAELTPELLQKLEVEQSNLILLQNNSEVRALLRANNSQAFATTALLYLVDPRGVAMMVFTPQNTGSDLLSDVNHLLKSLP